MLVTTRHLSSLLAASGIRHHVDREEDSIRVVFVTTGYVNPRAERLAILRVEVADRGRRCRVTLDRAFAAGRSAAATCLALCRGLGEVPFARVELDAPGRAFRLVAEMPMEDGGLTAGQLCTLLDSVVAAAEAGQAVLGTRSYAARKAA
ncbi:MAG: hypothetical protein ACKOCX_00870 [Planctomycetota bacterium]